MQRRQFVLTALLAGPITGCVGFEANDSPTESNDSTATPENDSTETMNQENETSVMQHIEVTNVETPPEDVPVCIGIDVLEDQITPDQPARLEFGFVITDDIRIRTDLEAPVGKNLSDPETPGLVLLRPQEASDIPRESDERWKPGRPKDQDWTARSTAYESEHSAQSLLASELELWADHQYDGYFEPGDYRFQHRFRVDGEQVSWSFIISVTDPQ
jgi:hypothetical protein